MAEPAAADGAPAYLSWPQAQSDIKPDPIVRYGVLRRARYQESPARYEYILTQRGLDLYPVVMSIVHWGDMHMVDERGRPLLHQHKNCGKQFDPVMVCSECGEPLHAKEVHTHPGPGAPKAVLVSE